MFDAVGTLMVPARPVSESYCEVAKQKGVMISQDTIRERFPLAVSSVFRPAGKRQFRVDQRVEKDQWRQIVHAVFRDSFTTSLFEGLWDYFADPQNWSPDPEAKSAFERCQQQGMLIGVASNFDDRLTSIVAFHFPELDPALVFHSAKVGFAKPDVRFYKAIECRLFSRNLRDFRMVGDDWECDVEAARRAGWRASHRGRGVSLLTALRESCPEDSRT